MRSENLEAIDFLQFNQGVYAEYPDVLDLRGRVDDMADGRGAVCGGLGFGLKWDLGWMRDTLNYFEHDPSIVNITTTS
jgi:1,4-alpha-glucan branching enzyme